MKFIQLINIKVTTNVKFHTKLSGAWKNFMTSRQGSFPTLELLFFCILRTIMHKKQFEKTLNILAVWDPRSSSRSPLKAVIQSNAWNGLIFVRQVKMVFHQVKDQIFVM